MPNRRTRRRKNKKPKTPKSKLTASFVDKFIEDCNKNNTSKEVKKFHVYMLEREVYGPDQTTEYVIFCLSSYFILNHMYDNLSLMYDLIPIEIIQEEALKDFKFQAGLSEQTLKLIKIRTENYSPQNKIVLLILDESSIRSEVSYSEKYDQMIGFVDNGKVRTHEPAKFVTNLWIQCIGGTWMMPFAYIFTANYASVSDIKELLFESVSKLVGIGLDVVGMVTKMRTNFYELSQELNISPTNQQFKVGDHELVFLYDVPQLMNITRNNLMKYKFKFENMQTSWKDIKSFFILENQQENRKTKLTQNHIKPTAKMRAIPRMSIELLSNSVAVEMKSFVSSGKLPAAAIGTAECIERFDKLFDMMNSRVESSLNEYNGAFKGTKHQMRFIEKMIAFFENLKISNSDDEDVTDQVKFTKGWLITIRGMLKMWDVVKAKGNYEYLLTRNNNCEVLDKFMDFVRISLFCLVEPTAGSFLDLYERFFVSSYFQEDNLPRGENMEFEDFIKKVYKRVPPTKHDLKDEVEQENHDVSVDLDFKDFVKGYVDTYGF